MSGYRIVMVQAGSSGSGQAPQPSPAPQVPEAPQAAHSAPTREQIRTQIRQTIQDATRAAAEASGKGPVIMIDGRPVIADVRDMPGIAIHQNDMDNMIPPQAVDMTIAFFIMLAVIIIGLPIARAMGRRIERKAMTPALPDPAISEQLQRIEQAVEAMSIEVERISESQRFMAKLQNGAGDRSVLGAGERR